MTDLSINRKPILGISCGDLNGIGVELIIKSLADNRILEFCIPVVFGNNKLVNFYRKTLPEVNLNFKSIASLDNVSSKQVNILNCWEEEVSITPGELNDTGGKYATLSLEMAANALKNGDIDVLVTAPIHKKNVYKDEFPFTGHTPFLKHLFDAKDVLMLMTAGDFKVGLVTEHVPIKDLASYITQEAIIGKLKLLNQSLRKDFNIDRPKIAVLGLNPHAGDDRLIGTEEEDIIKPAIKEAKDQKILAVGPFPADAFFARGMHHQFDATLAMYHDQGLIPFKSLAIEEGVNFTAGLEKIRTSPDHGTAFDIAGKGKADASSFTAAIFESINIFNNQVRYTENRQNPMKKLGESIIRNSRDE